MTAYNGKWGNKLCCFSDFSLSAYSTNMSNLFAVETRAITSCDLSLPHLQATISQLLTRWYPQWNSSWNTVGVMTCWRLEEEKASPGTLSHFLCKIVSTRPQDEANMSPNHRMCCTGQHVAKQGFILKIRLTFSLTSANVTKCWTTVTNATIQLRIFCSPVWSLTRLEKCSSGRKAQIFQRVLCTLHFKDH